MKFRLEYILEFSSDRKRMSVIVKNKNTGEYQLYSKGADNVMLKRLDRNQDTAIDMLDINDRLSIYASYGLRTLVLAWKTIPVNEYLHFSGEIANASNHFGNRDEMMAKVMDEMEYDL